MSYTLEKDQSDETSYVEKWIPYKLLPFEKDDSIFRHEQLLIRTRECSQTLDLLSKLNDGCEIEHIQQPSMDLSIFKVYISR